MGHRVAFGNTAEHYRRLVYGWMDYVLNRRGSKARTRPPLPFPDTGVGCVAPHAGQYADALSRRTKVCLILEESLGGIYYASKLQLHKLSPPRAPPAEPRSIFFM